MKNLILAALLGILLVASGSQAAMDTALVTIAGGKKKVELKVEVAESETEREQGLMNRRELPEGTGMLFIFDYERPVSMWMKDTRIPLDMIFIDGKGEVKKIYHNAKPYSLKIIQSEFPVLYTLEVPGGFAAKNGIKAGDVMTYKTVEAR